MTPMLLALLLAGAPDAPRAAPAPSAPLLPTRQAPPHEAGTRCAACHGTASWSEVRFNHARTGWPLTGRHERVGCKACHVTDFTAPVPRTCAGCHRDVHAGELGARCEGCHEAVDWRSRFDVEVHRRTNFPLLGSHAAIPCVECHLEARERRFARATVDCAGCHQGAVARTRGTAVDHTDPRTDFSRGACRECHGAVAFRPARWAGHDACFPISTRAHAGIACSTCHTSLGGAVSTGRCLTNTADCTGCHEHACTTAGQVTETDRQHTGVLGYQCKSRKCYECHRAGEEVP